MVLTGNINLKIKQTNGNTNNSNTTAVSVSGYRTIRLNTQNELAGLVPVVGDPQMLDHVACVGEQVADCVRNRHKATRDR